MDKVTILPFVDFQHDALAVFDDVEQGIVLKEDVWVSAYHVGQSSVNGKIGVSVREGGGVDMTSREGVEVERVSKTNFLVTVPSLSISNLSVRFPRQVVNLPYTKATNVSPELHVNSIDYSDKSGQLVVGGTDGYAVVVSPTDSKALVELKSHVGDVLHVEWFPSGEVVLTASSDLSVRIFSSQTGINPRTLRGHTRAITATHIVGVGRQVLSASKDGTVRLWDVGKGEEVKQWNVYPGKFIDAMVVVEDARGLRALGVDSEDEHIILAATPDGTVSAFALSSDSGSPALFTSRALVDSRLECIAYSPATGLIATGHTNGTIVVRNMDTLLAAPGAIEDVPPLIVRRNVGPVFSLVFVDHASGNDTDLLVGTSAGLPCRLGLAVDGATITPTVKEEYAGWEAVSVETWAVASDGVWCAGGEGGVKRY